MPVNRTVVNCHCWPVFSLWSPWQLRPVIWAVHTLSPLFLSVHLQFLLRVYFNFSCYYTNLYLLNYFQLIYFSMFCCYWFFCSFTLLPTSSLHRLIWAISYRFAVIFYQLLYLGWNFDKPHTHTYKSIHYNFFFLLPDRLGLVCAMWFVMILPFTLPSEMFCIYIFLVHCWTIHLETDFSNGNKIKTHITIFC